MCANSSKKSGKGKFLHCVYWSIVCLYHILVYIARWYVLVFSRTCIILVLWSSSGQTSQAVQRSGKGEYLAKKKSNSRAMNSWEKPVFDES